MQQIATTVASREIKPRPLELGFADTPKEWIPGDPYSTTLMNALSLTFPDGERFFVASVRALRDGIKDPVLAGQVKGFLAQEALHRREHDRFNQRLKAEGLDTDRFYAEIAQILGRAERRLPPMGRLAVTCALEHFTAIMAEMMLTNPEVVQGADEETRTLWQWHALEELDHKAVAFDVYRAYGGGYLRRIALMLGATVIFMSKVAQMQARLLAKDKQLKASIVLPGLWRYWGPRGYFLRLVPAYLRYFKPRFHPHDHDSTPLIQKFEAVLAARGVPQYA